MKSSKKILFVTGTRADYSKIRPIFKYFYDNTRFNINIYITGMHLMSELGNTSKYIENDIKKYFSSIEINKCKEKIVIILQFLHLSIIHVYYKNHKLSYYLYILLQ